MGNWIHWRNASPVPTHLPAPSSAWGGRGSIREWPRSCFSQWKVGSSRCKSCFLPAGQGSSRLLVGGPGEKPLIVGLGLQGYRSCLRVMCLNPPKWTALQFSIPRIPAACWHGAHSKGRASGREAAGKLCSSPCGAATAPHALCARNSFLFGAAQARDGYSWGAVGERIWGVVARTPGLDASLLPAHPWKVIEPICWLTTLG